ncbi:TniQ family protein [Paenibacillus sp. L3-i20]|uniref:TniQ family protein n=1 Tax=Paenibacillus sp. L3-i20 TaxID=2905833 RepID=UPI001EDDBA92|nr:TniQ family protein [Paenibacillus sp. L3-i20]GKU76628.1 hypothetical protein L3i20_v210250 [Paenibacillus sp. L3-i20]
MTSIISFPEPFPDEDFRSIVFRYHLRSANKEFNESRLELFGTQSYKLPLFPKNLNHLVNKLPKGHRFSINGLLFDHTWFGLYKVFLSADRQMRVFSNIRYGTNTQHGHPPVKELSVLTLTIKYCPLCMQNDEYEYGEVFIHRMHQLSFLEVCPKHKVRLLSNCPICKNHLTNPDQGVLLKLMECNNGHRLPVEYIVEKEEFVKTQISLAEELITLRDRHYELSNEIIRDELLAQLYRRGYITPAGLILKKQLFSDFNRKISSDIRNALNLTNHSLWFINNIFKKEYMVSYIGFYLLLTRLLGNTLVDVLKPNALISEKIFLKQELSQRNQNQKELVTKGMSEIIQARQQIGASIEIDEKKDKMRQRMSVLLLDNDFKTRSEIRRKKGYLFNWLLINDTQWLEERIPRKIDSKWRKLDFEDMDEDLQQKIHIAGISIDSNYPLPIRQSTLLQLLNAYDRNHYKTYVNEFLPKAKEEISKFVETPKQFLIRSIPRNYEKLLRQGMTSTTVVRFKNAASVSYYLNGDEEVDEHIANFLREKGSLIE